jgi:hypothetical protein
MKFLFNHSGASGDILFSLHFCKELSEAYGNSTFDFNIQTNVPDPNLAFQKHPNGSVRMSVKAAEMLKALLETQSYIDNVYINDNIPTDSFEYKVINLDKFRQLPINFQSGDIRRWYYNIIDTHLPADFTKPVITCEPNYKYKNKILLIYTERYVNIAMDYNVLKPFKDKLVFIGLPNEYEIFKQRHFDLEYCPTKDLLEAGKYIAGAKCVIGNQSGLFSLAECMKVPRILCSAEYFRYNNQYMPGPVNVHPQGGWNEVAAITEKLKTTVQTLLI